MKKVNLYILLSLTLGMLSLSLEASPNVQSVNSTNVHPSAQHSTSVHNMDEDDEDEEDWDDEDDYDDEDDDEDDYDDEDDDDDEDDQHYNIIKRDQVDRTDALAIPLDDSEVEDEEEIDRLERKNTFKLPHSR